MSRKANKLTVSNILGVDYGKSKIGLAIADSETRMAFGYGTMKNDKNLLQEIAKTIKEEKISKVIIGVTSHLEVGGPSKQLGSRRSKLVDFLKKELKIDVEYQDEMYSTKMAERNLKEKGMKKIKKYDDQEAARIILQSWLDKNA